MVMTWITDMGTAKKWKMIVWVNSVEGIGCILYKKKLLCSIQLNDIFMFHSHQAPAPIKSVSTLHKVGWVDIQFQISLIGP